VPFRREKDKIMKRILLKLLSSVDRIDVILAEKRIRRSPKRNLHNILWERASAQSADFVEAHLGNVLVFDGKVKMWSYVAKLLNENFNGGVCLEFGVAGGTSINFLSRLLSNFKFVGFDSFIGLKDDWVGHHATKGAYSQNGVLPKVNSNVSLVKGWFNATIPNYIEENNLVDLRLIHIDSDTYEAAEAVFDELGKHLKPGMFVLFDELLGYPNWQNGEYKALNEAQNKYGFNFQYRAFSNEQALIEITL